MNPRTNPQTGCLLGEPVVVVVRDGHVLGVPADIDDLGLGEEVPGKEAEGLVAEGLGLPGQEAEGLVTLDQSPPA